MCVVGQLYVFEVEVWLCVVVRCGNVIVIKQNSLCRFVGLATTIFNNRTIAKRQKAKRVKYTKA